MRKYLADINEKDEDILSVTNWSEPLHDETIATELRVNNTVMVIVDCSTEEEVLAAHDWFLGNGYDGVIIDSKDKVIRIGV